MASLRDLWANDRTPRERVEPTFAAASPENPSTSLSNPAQWLMDWAGVSGSDWGPPINERTAMAVSAVFRCVAIRAALISGLPLKIYRRTPEGREEQPHHRVAPMLQVAPMPGGPLTAFSWRESLSAGVDLWGNSYAVIRRDLAARVIGFEPVMPMQQVEVSRLPSGANSYVVNWNDGRLVPRERVEQGNMLHFPGLGFDGIKGMSRIQSCARDAVSMAKLLEQQTGRVHENAARPSGLMELPPNITPEGKARMEAFFNAQITGRSNAGKLLYGDAGAKFTQFQISPVDLGTIEQRRFQVADISRFFGVPLPLLNETDKSTSWGSGLAEQNASFLIFTMDSELGRIEAELNYKLFAGSESYAEFVREGLLAMDPLKSAQVAQAEVSFGGLTPNEYRRAKNRPPVEGGDTPFVNSTNIPIERALNPPAPAAPGQPPKESSHAAP